MTEIDGLLLAQLAIGLSLTMSGAWAVQRLTGSSGWVDTIWSFAVGAFGLAAALFAEGAIERRWMVAAFVLLWSLRLGGHIGLRTRGAAEDPRYQRLIEEWGDNASFRLFLFLQIQAIAAFTLVLAIHIAASGKAGFPILPDMLGGAIALIALGGEALADRQLQSFRRQPQAKARVMESGLWAYSRHPNYFFEWLFWCALVVISLSSPGWAVLLALLAPAQMYWLLVHVSGIPPLEDHMLRSRGDQFRALQTRVNAFFPGPRRTLNQR